jgi:hypothetical protein
MKTIIAIIILTSILVYHFFKKQLFTLLFNILILCIDLFDKRSRIGQLIGELINKLLYVYPDIDFGLDIIEMEFMKDHRCLNIRIENRSKHPYHKLLPIMYYKLQCNELFKGFASYKVILSTAQTPTTYYSMHDNFLITPSTTIIDFYHHYLENLLDLSRRAYNLDNIEFINMKAWNMDDQRNKHIKFDSNKIVSIDDVVEFNSLTPANNLNIVPTNYYNLNNMRLVSYKINTINEQI